MSENPYKITKVEIKSLWGKHDLVWNLHPDVNILAGINGSGKSTILKVIESMITLKHSSFKDIISLVENVNLCFTDENVLKLKKKSIKSFSVSKHFNANDDFDLNFIINTISTFDSLMNETEAVKKLSNDNIKTELDFLIYNLIKPFLNYKLNIDQLELTAYRNGNINKSEVELIRQPLNRFLDIIDELFNETGKKINRQQNEITFISDDAELTPYQLSSGEKQILLILLTTLVQNNKPALMLLDEPEISLHFDWQKKLIGYILELNPNIQLIIATHSPALIIEGWQDKVSEVRDLIV